MRPGTDHTIFAERDGWTVIDSWENVPEGRYEVRSPEGRQYGIWESLEAATRHMEELATAKLPAYPATAKRPEDMTAQETLTAIFGE